MCVGGRWARGRNDSVDWFNACRSFVQLIYCHQHHAHRAGNIDIILYYDSLFFITARYLFTNEKWKRN